jgi:GNAT superfamily N-acetyltransferase
LREWFDFLVNDRGIDMGYQSVEDELASLPGAYGPPKGRMWLACDDAGEAIGCVALRPMPNDGVCELKRLYVRPAHRGEEIGRALTTEAIDEARAMGYRLMRLDTGTFLDASRRLDASLGFIETGPYYDVPPDVLRVTVFMELSLTDGIVEGGLDMEATIDSMLTVLSAQGPVAEYSSHLMLYGRFVGAWDGTVTVYRRDGTSRTESCEVYFDWVLEGRAIQDVWIAPARKDRAEPGRDGSKDMYGTTIRVYDPENDNWQITWIDPNTQGYGRMTGRQLGDDIVQEYVDEDGVRWEWRFTDMTDESFRWLARESSDDGKSWQLRNEFDMRRRDMIDTSDIDRWLERYQAAWLSGDPAQIAALFTDDVRYFTAPHREPLVGTEAVIAYWLEQGESQIPWTFEYEVVAREGVLHVVRGVTRYPEGTVGASGAEEFHNLWLVTLTGEGRVREFVEYFVLAE